MNRRDACYLRGAPLAAPHAPLDEAILISARSFAWRYPSTRGVFNADGAISAVFRHVLWTCYASRYKTGMAATWFALRLAST
jgi:hypothetical protein